MLALMVYCGFTGPSRADDQEVEAATRYMTTDELFEIYHNRSWIWSDGAGYFPNKERKFTAYSGSGSKAAFAEGKWFLTWMGKACFRATWHGTDYDTQKLTCFGHRTDGNIIYQRTEPNGEWYVFKGNRAGNTDEIAKFLLGDYVSAGLNRNRTTLGK
jgi:Protein of unknown function (DUF995)